MTTYVEKPDLVLIRVRTIHPLPLRLGGFIPPGTEGTVTAVDSVKFEFLLDGVDRTYAEFWDKIELIVPPGIVPQTHQEPRVKAAWINSTALLDATRRTVPKITPEKYEEIYGYPWQDTRIFKVEFRQWAGWRQACSKCGHLRPYTMTHNRPYDPARKPIVPVPYGACPHCHDDPSNPALDT